MPGCSAGPPDPSVGRDIHRLRQGFRVRDKGIDIVLADTAGRLPTHDSAFAPDPRRLMQEAGLEPGAVHFTGFVPESAKPALYRGARASVSMGFLQDFHLLLPRGAAARLKAELITKQPLMAPVRRGQRLGTLRLILDGTPLGDYPLVALHDVSVAGVFGRGWDSIRLFFGQ